LSHFFEPETIGTAFVYIETKLENDAENYISLARMQRYHVTYSSRSLLTGSNRATG
jgi:hypothetical protein